MLPTGSYVAERRGEFVELGEMSRGELGDELVTFFRQLHAHDPGVVRIRRPADHAGRLGAIHESDRAMALQQQVLRDLAHRRGLRAGMAFDRHQ